MNSVTPSMASYQSGAKVAAEHSFIWTITNFSIIMKQRQMINFQSMEYCTTDTSSGSCLKWTLSLQAFWEDCTRWIDFRNRVEETPELNLNEWFAQSILVFKDGEGNIAKKLDSGVLPINNYFAPGYQFRKVIDTNAELPYLVDDNLVVAVTVKLMYATRLTLSPALRFGEFMAKSRSSALKDLACLPDSPVSWSYIKVMANDNEEVGACRGLLAARSPVFHAMLESNMVEGNTGLVRIEDIGSKALKVLIRYLHTGELLPEWKDSRVITELTNAAAKYQLPELLQFLDGELGSVCDLDNVGALLLLAHRLHLKSGEDGLLSYIRSQGCSSSQNYMKMLEGLGVSMSMAEPSGEGSSDSSSNVQIHDHVPSFPSPTGNYFAPGKPGHANGRRLLRRSRSPKFIFSVMFIIIAIIYGCV